MFKIRKLVSKRSLVSYSLNFPQIKEKNPEFGYNILYFHCLTDIIYYNMDTIALVNQMIHIYFYSTYIKLEKGHKLPSLPTLIL